MTVRGNRRSGRLGTRPPTRFSRFMELPIQLRDQIWTEAMPNRVLTVIAQRNNLPGQVTVSRGSDTLRSLYFTNREAMTRVLDLYTLGLRGFNWAGLPFTLPRQLPGFLINLDNDTLLFRDTDACFAFCQNLLPYISVDVQDRLIEQNRSIRFVAFGAEERNNGRGLYINWGLLGTFTNLDIIYLEFEGPEVGEAYGLSRRGLMLQQGW